MDELLNRLKELVAESQRNPETAHPKADELLVAFINDTRVTELFNAIEKWYA